LTKTIFGYIIKKWRESMDSVVIDRRILPEPIFSYIHSEKIRMFEENGNIILSPIVEKYSIIKQAFGMFSDGKLSSEEFIKEKEIEKGLEM
jgi:hypothetical protein